MGIRIKGTMGVTSWSLPDTGLMVHRYMMGSKMGFERLKSNPVVRRIAMVALVAGFGGIAWYALSRTPVESRTVVSLKGGWPPLRSVRLAYYADEEHDPLREVRTFPKTGTRDFDDSPQLRPGSYRLEVTVETTQGAQRFVRTFEHERGVENCFLLRFGDH